MMDHSESENPIPRPPNESINPTLARQLPQCINTNKKAGNNLVHDPPYQDLTHS